MSTKIKSFFFLILSFLFSPIYPMQTQRYRQAAQLVAAQTAQQRVLNKHVKPPKLKVEDPQMLFLTATSGGVAVAETVYFGGTIVIKVIEVAAVAGTAAVSALVYDYLHDNRRNLSPQEKEIRRKTNELRLQATIDLNALRDCDGYLGPITQITDKRVELYLIENRHKEPIKSLLAEFAADDARLPLPNFDQAPPEGQVRRRTRTGPVVQYSQAAKKALATATAQGEVLHAYRLRYNEETLTIDLLPANPDYEKILLAAQPKNPNGLYRERGPQHKLPLAGQKALDEAVWILHTGKLWGMENGKSIWFMKNSSDHYDGHFVERPGIIKLILDEQARKRTERDAYWATRIAQMVALEYQENATPQELLNRVQDRTEEEKKEDEDDRAELEQRRPNGAYQALSADQALENGQAILNEAIWNPESRRLYGFNESGGLIVFAPQNQNVVSNLPSAFAHGLAGLVIRRQRENRSYRRFVRSLNAERASDFILNNYHPNGLYVPATGKPAAALPQQGQVALDCAVCEYSTGNLWGIEGDRLILFTYQSKVEGWEPTYRYEGSFYEGDVPAGMLELVRGERQEMDRVRKAAGALPPPIPTPPLPRPRIEEEHPYGLYNFVKFEGQWIRDGQRVLDGAVWDPTHEALFGLENGSAVRFTSQSPGAVHSNFTWQGSYADTRSLLCEFGRGLVIRKQRETATYNDVIQRALREIRELGAAARIDIRAVERAFDSYHPNGLYFREPGSRNLPQNGQAALDDAVLEPATGYFWGVEDDRLIRFEFSGPRNGEPYSFTYAGSFYEGRVPAGVVGLAKKKKNRAEEIKNTIRNRPLIPEEEHPHGRYTHISVEGPIIPDGQQVLDAAIWDPITDHNLFYGMAGDRLVLFVLREAGAGPGNRWQGSFFDTNHELYGFAKGLVTRKQQEVTTYKNRIDSTLTEIMLRGAEAKLHAQEIEDAFANHHPNGLYLGERDFAGLPQNGQAALDDAVLDPVTHHFWGVENDRLICFTYAGQVPNQPYMFQYTGRFHAGAAPAGMLERAKNKKNKANIIKKKIREGIIAANGGAPRDPRDDEERRKKNDMSKQEFFKDPAIKNNYRPHRDGSHVLKDGGTPIQRDVERLAWDHVHNDVEAYNKHRLHMGSIDPRTKEFYKNAVPGREFPKS